MAEETTTKTDWNAKLEALKKEYLFDEEEAENAFKFVAQVISLEIDRLEADEPYATKAIERYQAMESEIYHFENFIACLRPEGD